MRIETAKETVKGIFGIPYKEIRKSFEGEYHQGLGYVFDVATEQVREFLLKCEKTEELEQALGTYWRKERLGLLKWGWCLRRQVVGI